MNRHLGIQEIFKVLYPAYTFQSLHLTPYWNLTYNIYFLYWTK